MKSLSLILLALMMSACSNQWREAGGADPSTMIAALAEVSSAQATSTSGDLQAALAMKDQEGVRIYFAESMLGPVNSPMGSAGSILSFGDFSFLGAAGVRWPDIDQARAFFFDLPSESGHQNGLIIGFRKAGESALTYVGFKGTSTFDDGEMTVKLPLSAGGQLILRSYDVDGDDLDQVIQLLVFESGGDGTEYYLGKISTLIGFGD